MMRLLKLVIARLLGLITQPSVNPVPPTPTAGPVSKEHITPTGNKRSAQTSTQRQSQSPVRQPSPKKPKAAQSTKVVSKGTSKKREPAQTVKSQTTAGNSTPTRASKTRQHAK
jgi:hypothetical protein